MAKFLVLDEDNCEQSGESSLEAAKDFISNAASEGSDVSGWTVYKKVLSVTQAEIKYKIEE